jgi:D-serine deaminase-like pyridoxal phosphate-dependent protein
MPTYIKPALVLDADRARRNIERMAAKARRLGLRFRPHFKTHQSRAVGRVFRDCGVDAITVSSVDMAEYFAADGWRDILVAFPLNILELDGLRRLARRVKLGILVEATDGLAALAAGVARPVDVWVKIDIGANRAGLDWNDRAGSARVCAETVRHPRLRLRGLLTHNGRTYGARTIAALQASHADSLAKMLRARRALEAAGYAGLEISVGDTPSCSRLDDFAGVDEVRPGNFVLYDVTQLELGNCAERDVAAAVACPVVAVHARRREVVVYGGAIHLAKEDFLSARDGRIYGRVCRPRGAGWGPVLPGTSVRALSQEHGVVATTEDVVRRTRPGDILFVLPIHSCLTVDLWGQYLDLDGNKVPTIRSCGL